MKRLAFQKNAMIVLCGPAGCGKSYFAEKFFRPTQIVSSDRCREMIIDTPDIQRVSPDAFALMEQIIEYRLKYNRLTVADATHLLPSYRRPLLKLADRYDCPIYLIIFETNLKTCLAYNAKRDRQVERHIIESQIEKLNRVKKQLEKESYTAIYTLKPADVDRVEIELIPFN